MLRQSVESQDNEVSESESQITGKGILAIPWEEKFLKPYLSRTKSYH